MTRIGRGKLLLLVGFFAVAAVAASARPAAASTMSAQNDCEPSGVEQYYCDVTVSGGVAPYSYSWVVVRNASITVNHGWLVSGRCFNTTMTLELQVTVTDSTGAQLVDSLSGPCSGGPA
jgi:hypothetical protein